MCVKHQLKLHERSTFKSGIRSHWKYIDLFPPFPCIGNNDGILKMIYVNKLFISIVLCLCTWPELLCGIYSIPIYMLADCACAFCI